MLAWGVVPWVGSFSYDPTAPFASHGTAEAIYTSGTALTTVGFGDTVPTSMLMRLIALVEAAAGFGALSASIAFVLSVYPLLSQVRATGIQTADSGVLQPEGAAWVLREAGAPELAATVA